MSVSPSLTLLDKVWNPHVIADLGDGIDLLHVDRHLLHDIAGVFSLEDMAESGQRTVRPDLTIATVDHAVASAPNRREDSSAVSLRYLPTMRTLCDDADIPLFDLQDRRQGIVHVIAPELGLSLPGLTIVCGDSHTCTHGAMGALAWGIGSSEVTHVLATQTIRQKRPMAYRIWLDGALADGVDAKDAILYCIGQLGSASGTGAAVEFDGAAVRAMSMEQRFVLCNMAIEMGAKFALISPDEVTLSFLEGLEFSPKGQQWDDACAYWRTLKSDPDAVFDFDVRFDCAKIEPQVTWGTNPEHVDTLVTPVPDPAYETDPARREAVVAAQAYMAVQPGETMAGKPIDWVFIGSCAGGYLSDLRIAARVLDGRHVAPGVTMWVVPGSRAIQLAAEAEHLDQIFLRAGAQWRASGCSLCSAANGEVIPRGARSVSTSNRNFVGRQGPGVRTHLASPATAAASAVLGVIADARMLEPV